MAEIQIPSIPKKLWQTVALINLIPEITSIVLFRNVAEVLTYVVACTAIVIIVYALEPMVKTK